MINRLIVNADDFALTSGISRAIVEAHQKGIVTSTTILGNCDEKLLEEAVELSRQNPELGIGAHLVLTTRKPLLEDHKTLVDELGNFALNEKADLDEVYEEWKAQINRLKEHFKLTHIDSHHHVHLREELKPIATRLSKEFKLPMRSDVDNFPFGIKVDAGFYRDSVSVDYIKEACEKEKGLLEIMVHPGYADDTFLQEISSYSLPRQKELEVLCDDSLKEFIKENNIELVNYSFIHLK